MGSGAGTAPTLRDPEAFFPRGDARFLSDPLNCEMLHNQTEALVNFPGAGVTREMKVTVVAAVVSPT